MAELAREIATPRSLDDVRAFELLRRLPQESRTKLVDIAQRVIDTRGED